MKDYVFFFHYNKPASKAAGKVQVTVHYKNKCHIVDNVVINVPVKGRTRDKQPRFVMAGKCKSFKIDDANVGHIA